MNEHIRRPMDRVSIVPYITSGHTEKPGTDGVIFKRILFKGVIKKVAFCLKGTGAFMLVCTVENAAGSRLFKQMMQKTSGVFDLDIPVADGDQLIVSCMEAISDISISLLIESEYKIKVAR